MRSLGAVHAVPFRGSVAAVETLEVPDDGRTVLVTDAGDGHDHGHALVVPVDSVRPSPAQVDAAVAAVGAVEDRRRARLMAVGSGAALDVAKLAARDVGVSTPPVLVPCGREPWRAFAPFAVVLEGPGEQRTVTDTTMGAAEVWLVLDRLARVPPPTVAVTAMDTLVHAIESVLSTRCQPYVRALAVAAATTATRTLAHGSDGSLPDATPAGELVVAAALGTAAFTTTQLGLAHALATHLGARMGVCHDRINAVAGRAVVAAWSGHDRLQPLADAVCTLLDAPDLASGFDRLLDLADLPRTLVGEGIPWEDVASVLPLAATSTGLRTLPQPLQDGELESFARSAWDGDLTTTRGRTA